MLLGLGGPRAPMRSIAIQRKYSPVALFILANIADAATTMASLNGGVREINPVVAALIGSLGLETAMAVKILVASAAGALLYWRRRMTVLTVLTIGLVLVSLNNALMTFF